MTGLPQEVLQALARGQQIEAIRLLREASGLGLKDAKDAVDAHLRGESVMLPSADVVTDTAPQDVIEALRRGNKIDAVRRMRAHTGLGLKEAKERVDVLQAQHGLTGLAPGEVRRGRGWWWVIAVMLAGAVAYWLAQ
jgi:ribosomal protein L7/L12